MAKEIHTWCGPQTVVVQTTDAVFDLLEIGISRRDLVSFWQRCFVHERRVLDVEPKPAEHKSFVGAKPAVLSQEITRRYLSWSELLGER